MNRTGRQSALRGEPLREDCVAARLDQLGLTGFEREYRQLACHYVENALTADAPTAAILFFGAEKPESRSGERRKAPLAPAVARQSEAGGRLDEDV